MLIKTKFISIVILLSLFISNSGFGSKFIAPLKGKAEVHQSVSESPNPAGEETISTINDILHSSIRITGTSHHLFHCLKNNKKSPITCLPQQASLLFNSYYSDYQFSFSNNINRSPFYIAYHRLII